MLQHVQTVELLQNVPTKINKAVREIKIEISVSTSHTNIKIHNYDDKMTHKTHKENNSKVTTTTAFRRSNILLIKFVPIFFSQNRAILFDVHSLSSGELLLFRPMFNITFAFFRAPLLLFFFVWSDMLQAKWN